MVYDPDAEAAKLAELIHQDQALAAHVIRIANSPAYMTRNPVVSLQHAVSMLGMNLMSELAFSASIKGSAFKVPGWDDEVKSLWHYSLASGAYAKEIARMRRFNVESAYLCGLLHGIGRPVVLQTLVALSRNRAVLSARSWCINSWTGITSRSDFWLQTIGGCRRRSWSLSGFMWTTNMPKLPSRNV